MGTARPRWTPRQQGCFSRSGSSSLFQQAGPSHGSTELRLRVAWEGRGSLAGKTTLDCSPAYFGLHACPRSSFPNITQLSVPSH